MIQTTLVVNRFEVQLIWLSHDLRFTCFGHQLVWDSSESEISFSARLPSKMKLGNSKTKLCARLLSKMKLGNSKINETFVRERLDFLEIRSFEE